MLFSRQKWSVLAKGSAGRRTDERPACRRRPLGSRPGGGSDQPASLMTVHRSRARRPCSSDGRQAERPMLARTLAAHGGTEKGPNHEPRGLPDAYGEGAMSPGARAGARAACKQRGGRGALAGSLGRGFQTCKELDQQEACPHDVCAHTCACMPVRMGARVHVHMCARACAHTRCGPLTAVALTCVYPEVHCAGSSAARPEGMQTRLTAGGKGAPNANVPAESHEG